MTNYNSPLIKSVYTSPAGDITIIIEDDTIIICEFSDRNTRVTRQLERFYPDHIVIDGPLPNKVRAVFDKYFEGGINSLNTLKSEPIGTPFEQSVWKELQTIPAGTTWSYGQLAKRLGSAPRAVGRANGRNPVCLIHPCHRVIGADGSLTGYAGGLERKEWLLKHEGCTIKNIQ
jgi:methylated-DNA-[protein]-cysteine S-methyltransferase